MSKYVLGLDLGQSQDYTAICVLECILKEPQQLYYVRHLERPPLLTPYPDVVDRVSAILGKLEDVDLVVDQTGCGAAVVDLFKKAGLNPRGISIHGGDKVTIDWQSHRVPKRDLVAALQVCLQTSRLKVSSKLQLAAVLSSEMMNFKVKIDPNTAHDSYSAWRENAHDDLILATALAVWWAERYPYQEVEESMPLFSEDCVGEEYYQGPF